MGTINTYRDLIVWQRSKALAVMTYRATEGLPKSEVFGLMNQMCRASVSISSNIAEGYAKRTRPEYLRRLHIAAGSLAELSTQYEIASELGMLKHDPAYNELLREVDRLLSSLITKLRATQR